MRRKNPADLTFDELLALYEKQTRRLEKIVRRSDAQTKKLMKLNETLKEISYIDYMTGVHNRKYFFDFSKKIVSFAKRKKQPLSLAILDIDKFKNINDTYGHPEGDEVIKDLAKIISNALREEDIFARFGGEEFVILFPNTDIDEAHTVAKRLQQLISIESASAIKYTVSIGIAQMDPENDDINTLIKNADLCLYKAKQNGRNRIETTKTQMV